MHRERPSGRHVHPGHPTLPAAVVDRARAHPDTGRAVAARSALVRLLQQNPPDPGARRPRSRVRSRPMPLLGHRVKAPRSAPHCPWTLPPLVEAYLADRNPAAALAAAEALTAQVPESTEALQLLALARLAAKQPEAARQALDRAWTLDPCAVAVAVQLAALEAQAGRPKRAREVLEQALRGRPGQPDLILALVDLDRREGQREAARTRLERALAERPEALRLRLWLVRLVLADGDPQRARAMLADLPEGQPYQPASRLLARLRGETALANGDRDAAWSEWKTLLDGDPGPVTLTEVAGYARRLGRLDEAVALYRRALAADPKDWMALNELAMLTLDDDPAAALGLAERAWAERPEYAGVADTLARALRALDARPGGSGAMVRVIPQRRTSTLDHFGNQSA